MPLIDEKTMADLRERLAASLLGSVEIRLYRKPGSGRLILPGGVGCQTCDQAEEIARSLAEVDPDRLHLTVVDVRIEDSEIESVPTLTIAAPGELPRITFQGLPSGYEFATLLDAIERVSGSGDGLAPEETERLASLQDEVEVMVFVTPSCPYCPGAAAMANRMALASPRVRSLIVEANEFPELSQRFEVQGVPRTVVNRAGAFVGALPGPAFVDAVLGLVNGEAA